MELSSGHFGKGSPRRGRIGRLVGVVLATAAIIVAVPGQPAEATKSVSWTTSGKSYSCSITSTAPLLDRTTKYLTISAKVVCNVSVSVTISMRAVEMEGTTEDLTNLMDSSTLNDYRFTTLVGSKGYIFKYTVKKACVNTPSDLTDGEEYATKASIMVFANGTSYASQPDRTTPSTNAYAC